MANLLRFVRWMWHQIRRPADRAWCWLREFVAPKRPTPRTLEEAIGAIQSLRMKVGEVRLGVAALAFLIPTLVAMAVLVGQEGREHNCRVTRDAIKENNKSTIRAWIEVSGDETPADVQDTQNDLELFLSITNSDLEEYMKDCR